MSLSDIRPYFRDRLDSLDYTEWRDGFNLENIPETVIDKSYHILVQSIGGESINHTHQDTFSSVIVTVFFRGYRDVTEAIDEAISSIETIIKDVCKVANRTSTLLNVVFESADLAPLAETNDNSVIVAMEFTAQVVIGVEEV